MPVYLLPPTFLMERPNGWRNISVPQLPSMATLVSAPEIATRQLADMSPYLVTKALPEPDQLPERLSKNVGGAASTGEINKALRSALDIKKRFMGYAFIQIKILTPM